MMQNKPSIRDTINTQLTCLANLKEISKMSLGLGPVNALKQMQQYPWLWDLMKVNGMLKRMSDGRTGNYRKAVSLVVKTMVKDLTDTLQGVLSQPDRSILHQGMFSNEIFRAMGLNDWLNELPALMLPLLDPNAATKYIDAAENEGYPADLCNFPKAPLGVHLMGHYPDFCAAVTPRLACDGEVSAYNPIQRKTNMPTFRLDIPFDFKGKRGEDYVTKELFRLIQWLEKNTPGKMDWDKLKEICETRNETVELEMELWEMLRQRPAPLAAEALWLPHVWAFSAYPGTKNSLQMYKDLVKLGEDNMKKGISAAPKENYRALLWNVTMLHFPDFFPWIENKYGVAMVMESMSHNLIPYIDTSSEEEMLRGLARITMQGPMARHLRGAMENNNDDLAYICQNYDIDMVIVAANLGCKQSSALNTIGREITREMGIPYCVVEYDLVDPRVASKQDIMDQIDDFMENVMKAEPLTA